MSEINTQRLGSLVLAAVVLLVLVPVFGMGVGMMGGGHMWGGGMWGTGGDVPGWLLLAGVVMQLLVLVVLVGGAVLLYRALAGDGGDEALDELRLAYARGDLTEEEYEQRRNRLERES